MNLCKTCGTICPFDDEHEECEHYKPMTNEDWLRSCNTEQLAEWLLAHMDCIDCPATSWEKCHKSYYACKEVMLEWLKQPHTESVTNCNE